VNLVSVRIPRYLAAMSEGGPIEQNRLIHRRWLFLADKIEADPALLKIAVRNISRWKQSDRLGNRWALNIWSELIEKVETSQKGLGELLHLIRADDDRSRQLKSCSPFPGILTTQELDQFTCASVL